MKLRIATRKSPLALAQTRQVIERLKELNRGLEVEEVLVTTRGDQILDRPLYEVGGKGLFIGEIETALREGHADVGVHSMKDVPAVLDPMFTIGCIPMRVDPRDCLVSLEDYTLKDLPLNARVGTSSLRRIGQLRAKRKDLFFVAIRGNIDTRLQKLEDGELDAVVLAAAGLFRLGKHQIDALPLPVDDCLPSAGQGALALEIRKDDAETLELLASFEHAETRIAVEAERACVKELEGSCQLPIAAFADIDSASGHLRLRARVCSDDGVTILFAESTATKTAGHYSVDEARSLGIAVGQKLVADGALTLTQAHRV